MITCQSEDDSDKNGENGMRWIAPVAERVGQERSDRERGVLKGATRACDLGWKETR